MIELTNVAISIHRRPIIAGASVTLASSSVTHLAGENGSGKTTLIRAIAGIQRYSGSILFDGTDVSRARSRLYVCWDDAAVFPYLSGYENVRMLLGRPVDRRRAASIAPTLADNTVLRAKGRALSHGQRKRVHLIAALLSGADYLVLDEALNGVDAPTAAEVSAALSNHAPNATVLVTGHHGVALEGSATARLRIDNGVLHSVPDAPTPAMT